MWRLIKLILILALIAAAALIAYAYVGPIFFQDDFAPPVRTISEPVTLETE